MQSRPTVSFVVPAYNEAAYLRPTLLAILRETRSVDCPTEIVVVDNASTDATRKIAKSSRTSGWSRSRAAWSRRAGRLSRNVGGAVANIDADTMLTEGWLKRRCGDLRADPGLAGLSGPYVYYDVALDTTCSSACSIVGVRPLR